MGDGLRETSDREYRALVHGHEVHLWCVWPDDVTDLTLLTAYRALLSPDEIARNQRFVFPKTRTRGVRHVRDRRL